MSDPAFWFVQAPGWLLVGYLVVAQCTAAVSYSLGVKMGTQEPAEYITDVGVAFFKGFAGADLVLFTPLLAVGLLGITGAARPGLMSASARRSASRSIGRSPASGSSARHAARAGGACRKTPITG